RMPLGQFQSYGQALLIGFQRLFCIALREPRGAGLLVADRQVALRSGVIGVVRQLCRQRGIFLVEFERLTVVAHFQLHIADLFVADREVALGLRVSFVLGQRRENVEALLVGLQRGLGSAQY